MAAGNLSRINVAEPGFEGARLEAVPLQSVNLATDPGEHPRYHSTVHKGTSENIDYGFDAGAFSRTVSDFTITYSTGMKKRFSTVETIMPPKTVVPTE